MSREAMEWALSTRVGDPTRGLILVALGKHAKPDGSGAWASTETLAEYAECSSRTVQRHIAVMLDGGLIREGDQSVIPDYIPARRRPIAYDLAMSTEVAQVWQSEASSGRRASAAAVGAAAGRKGADKRWGDTHDTPETHGRGDTHDTPCATGDTHDTPDGALWGDAWGDKWGDSRGDTHDTQTREETKNKTQTKTSGGGKPRTPRTTRTYTTAPDDLPITPDMRSWASEKGLTVDLDAATDEFLNHHRAKGTTFKDWVAGWRTWMLRTRQYGGPQVRNINEGGRSKNDAELMDLITRIQAAEAERAAQVTGGRDGAA